MRSWLLSAVVAASLVVPAYGAQGSGKPKAQEKKEAKQAQDAVKKARKHASKADELPYEQARKADEEGQKANKKAQKKAGAVGTAGESDEVLFGRLDRNRDGFLSRAEWKAAEAEFVRLDFDRDGRISPYEFGVGR